MYPVKRKSNMELLRIISMIFIIVNHLILNGIGWTDIRMSSLFEQNEKYVIGGLLVSFGIIGVNLFFMLSGYFQIRFTWKKWLTLCLTIYIYMMLIQVLGVLVGYQNLNSEVIKRMILPFNLYWFLKVYMVLMLLAPILNLLVEHADRRLARYFFMIFMLVFSVYTFLDNSEHLGVGRGFSLVFAVCLYLLGAFIKKGLLFSDDFFGKRKCVIIYFLACLANTLMIQIAINVLNHGKLASALLVYNNPFVVIETIGFFLFFSKLDINENSRNAEVIRYLSKNTLAVYILHSSNKVIDYYRNIPLHFLVLNNHEIIAYAIIVPYAVLIFCVCIFVDKIFQRMFGKVIDYFACKIGELLENIQEKYVR